MSAAEIVAADSIHVRVVTPRDTPADADVYLAGSSVSPSDWRADGLKLSRRGDGVFVGELEVELGQTLEFKITRGTWDTVEKLADGSERPNRSVTITADMQTIDVTVERWANGPEKIASTVVGTLKLHTIESKSLAASRTVRVWLPADYDASTQRYDVLYLQDGQNLFDRATSAFGHEWEVDEALTRLIAEKKLRPMIVVGIDNGGAERINELTFAADAKHGGGRADRYAAFLLDEVKPFVEKTYRIEPGPAHTFVGGSSLGGLFSLDLARRHDGIFGGVLAMSPSLWWRGGEIVRDIDHDPGGLAKAHVWLDMGTAEGNEGAIQNASYVDDAKRLDAALTKLAVTHRLKIEEGAHHNEEAWARRFAEAIEFIDAK